MVSPRSNRTKVSFLGKSWSCADAPMGTKTFINTQSIHMFFIERLMKACNGENVHAFVKSHILCFKFESRTILSVGLKCTEELWITHSIRNN